MNKERFAKLIQAVEERPKERFDMRWWGEKLACGTKCCAFGSYIEANPDSGFTLKLERFATRRLIVVKDNCPVRRATYEAALHFDIPLDDAEQLLLRYGDEDDSKPAVLASLREYMNTH